MKLYALGAIAVLLTGCSKTADVAETKVEAAVEAVKEAVKAAPVVVIPAGTAVRVRTNSTISSKTAAAGEAFSGSLAEPIVIDGKTVIAKGSTVDGVVANSDDGGRVKGKASVSLRITQIQADGKRLAVESSLFTRVARATKKDDAVKVGIGAGIGAAIGAIAGGGKGAGIGAASGAGAGTAVVLSTRGVPAVIGAESILTFRLTSAVSVD